MRRSSKRVTIVFDRFCSDVSIQKVSTAKQCKKFIPEIFWYFYVSVGYT